MQYRKMTRYEKKEVKKEMVANAMHGEGLYLYENKNKADLTLPRPTKSGLRTIKPKEQFQGDNYYMQYVRQGLLRLIKEIQSPQQEREALMQEEKLILDQPEMITEQGKVEHVVNKNTPVQKLQEGSNEKQPDVLLNESPSGDGFVIVTK